VFVLWREKVVNVADNNKLIFSEGNEESLFCQAEESCIGSYKLV